MRQSKYPPYQPTSIPESTFVSNILTMDPLRCDTYVRHLLDHDRASLEALQIARKLQDGDRYNGITSDYSIMLRLEQIKQWSFPDPEYPEMVIWVYHWGRDCDQMESSHISKMLSPSLEAFEEAENDMYDNAEGPCHMCFISPADAADFQPVRRDHAAEQMNY